MKLWHAVFQAGLRMETAAVTRWLIDRVNARNWLLANARERLEREGA